MKLPQTPPDFGQLISEINAKVPDTLSQLLGAPLRDNKYRHWDEIRHRTPPYGVTHREWWFAIKFSRLNDFKTISLWDKKKTYFKIAVPDPAQEELHKIDLSLGGRVTLPEPIINPQTRDRYVVSSLIQEAITSSQLEGAVTTREVAKEMIRTRRKPRDVSEQMILNNYLTMQRIQELKSTELTSDLIFEIHRLVTQSTLDDSTAAGRFRYAKEELVVGDEYGEIFHEPPPADELEERMEAMCTFANGRSNEGFIHPVVRAIILHFWLAYDHPFVDGNGRTARALFYWSMLHQGYWMFEFVSISTILRKAPAQYGRSFLYTETDENDLTYFLMAQLKVIRRAIDELNAYIARKTEETKAVGSRLKSLDLFNHRQAALIHHALKHPGHRYTFQSHQDSHNITYQTSRTDLLTLVQSRLLHKHQAGRQMEFRAPHDLSERLMKLEKRVLRPRRK